MAVTTEKFCLQWNEFQVILEAVSTAHILTNPSLQANLKTSYRGIRKTEDFSDVTLACEDGQQIEAHRVILSSSSLYFRDLLARNPARSHPLIYMRGIKFSDLSAIVDFIYHGEAEVMKDQLETFLEIAGELSVKGMTKQVGKQRRKPEAVEVADDEIDETEKILKIDEQVDSVADESLDENEDASMNNKATFSCDQCGKTLGSIGSLRTHMYNHKKKNAGGSAVKTEPSYRDASDDSLVQDSDSEEGGRLALLDRTVGDNTELEARIDAITERRDGLWTCTQCGKTDGSRWLHFLSCN
jgi:hypothetical protein